MVYNFKLKSYLCQPIHNVCKRAIARFVLSSHSLAIETGRFSKVPLSQRQCPQCKTGIEDEFHFLLECNIYSNIRSSLLKGATVSIHLPVK